MVMWMSRVERKKVEKKSKKYFKICLFIQIILLIFGLIAVDFEIREMLGIDESSLIGYKQLENRQYIVHIMGESYLVDVSKIGSQINKKFEEFGEVTYNIKKMIENKWQKVLQ